jgi:peptidyl-prolyl cis-trans isomerase B (cyclophilin B)
MYIENYGTIIMELYPDVAPNTVNNFISLIKSGFYDNNSFHRLVPGFVLQGGDPDGNGTGGPGYSIKGEFTSNGFENNLKHEKGIVSMARSSDNDSAGSQFFIMLDASSYLDGSYAAFGKVIDGFDIIEKIEDNEKVSDSSSGKLQTNLVIKKTLVDLKGKEYAEVEKIEE